jgi:hypothetical protein
MGMPQYQEREDNMGFCKDCMNYKKPKCLKFEKFVPRKGGHDCSEFNTKKKEEGK